MRLVSRTRLVWLIGLLIALFAGAQPASASSVSSPTVELSSTTTNAPDVTWRVDFTASPTGALAANAGTITVSAPAGTVFPSFGADLIDVTAGTDLGFFLDASLQNNGATSTWTVSGDVRAGDQLELVIPDVTNPASGGAVSVSTSADTTAVGTAPVTLTAPGSVSSPSVSLTSNVQGATGVTYLVDFTPSANGSLATFYGTVTVSLPNGSVIPDLGINATDLTTNVPLFAGDENISGSTATWTVDEPWSAGHLIELEITGVTNATAGGAVSVSTSSDPVPARTAAISLHAAHPVSSPSVSLTTRAASATQVSYTVGFTASSDGALATFNGTVTIALPNGSVIPDAGIGGRDLTSGESVFAGEDSIANAGATGTWTMESPVAAGDRIELDIPGVTNPATGGTVTISTSSDSAATTSFSTVARGSVGSPTATLSTVGAHATGVAYLVGFTPSSTGGLAAFNGTIKITLPPSSTIPQQGIAGRDVSTGQTLFASGENISGNTGTWTVDEPVPAGDRVEFDLTGVTNPPAGTSLAVAVATSSDATASTGTFSITARQPVGSPTVAISKQAASATGVAYTVAFTTSSDGALVAGDGTITVSLPAGSVIPNAGVSGVDVTGNESLFGSLLQLSNSGATATYAVDSTIPAGHRIRIAITGVKNPLAGTGDTIAVSTSSDTVTSTPAFAIGSGAAAPSVGPTAILSSNAAGVTQVAYTVVFTTTKALTSGSGTITLAAPTGTVLPDQGITIWDMTANDSVGTSSGPGSSGATETYTVPGNIPASHEIELRVDGVTNPGAGASNTITVSTSAQAGAQTNAYSTIAPQTVSGTSVALSSPTQSASGITYTIDVTTSSSGELANGFGTIKLTAPTGTQIPGSGIDIFDLTTDEDLGTTFSTSGTGNSHTWTVDNDIPAGHELRLTLTNVKNPSTGGTISISTSSDPTGVNTPSFSVTTPQPVSATSLALSSTVASAKHVTYAVGFTTSSTGGLAADQGTIKLTAPTGTQIPGSGIDIFDLTTDEDLGTTFSTSGTGNSHTWTVDNALPPDHAFRATISDVTNPAIGGGGAITISTSSDPTGTSTPSFSTTSPKAVSSPNVTLSTSARGVPHSTYTVSFTTSSTGALADSLGTITLAAPSGTVIPDREVTMVDLTADSTLSTFSPGTSGSTVTYTVASPVPAGHRIRMVIVGVTNPTTGGPIKVSTSSDTVTANTSSFTAATPASVVSPTVLLSDYGAGSTGVTYSIDFTTSPSGLLTDSEGDITVSAPAGTVIPAAGIDVRDVTSNEDLGETFDAAGSGSSVTWTVGDTIPAGDHMRLTIAGVKNPSKSAGQLTVSTSSDPVPAQTGSYLIGASRPAITAVSPSTGPAGGGTSVTITGTGFTGATFVGFGSNEATTFHVDSDTQITATAPAGLGTVDVTVAGPGGTSTTGAADRFTYASSVSTPSKPVVAPSPPSVQSSSAAALSGSVDPNGLATTAHFEYGLDPKYTGGGAVVYDQRTPEQTVGADFSNHTVSASLTGLIPNARYHVRLVATSSAGTVTGPDQTFTTNQDPAPPPPVLGQTANVALVSGQVFIKPPPGRSLGKAGDRPAVAAAITKGTGFIPLTEARQIPSGSEVDSRAGTLTLSTAISAQPGKQPQSGTFGGGLFQVTQSASRQQKGLTTLSLLEGGFPGAPSFASCGSNRAADLVARAAVAPRVLQTLHARDNHGHFQAKGHYSAGTSRGTVWDTSDRCDGTLTVVHRGSVQVFDFGKRKTILLHAGQRYLAKKPARTHKHR